MREMRIRGSLSLKAVLVTKHSNINETGGIKHTPREADKKVMLLRSFQTFLDGQCSILGIGSFLKLPF